MLDHKIIEKIRSYIPVVYEQTTLKKLEPKLERHKLINRVLLGVAVAMLLFIFFYTIFLFFRYGRADVYKRISKHTNAVVKRPSKRQNVPQKEMDMAIFQTRDIFQPRNGFSKQRNHSDIKSVALFKKAVKIVGITFDEEFLAIVENKFNKETLFVSKGDTVLNATVVDIDEDRVVFEIDNERIEIQP